MRKWVRRLLGEHLFGKRCNQMDVGLPFAYVNKDNAYITNIFEEVPPLALSENVSVMCNIMIQNDFLPNVSHERTHYHY